MRSTPTSSMRQPHQLLAGFLLTGLLGLPVNAIANGPVSQVPLHVRGDIPGNLALVPSVEWPTINSVANLGDYSESTVYAGYFDSGKCYQYHWSSTESERHFYPVSTTGNRRCTNSGAPWSGNFLNWAATQTIDPFRKAMTGGHRVRDDSSDDAGVRIRGTWLEKARHDGQGGTDIFPNRRIPAGTATNSTLVNGATPFNTNSFSMRIQGLGNRMRFRINSTSVDAGAVPYNPSAALSTDPSRACSSNGCEVVIRVRVCMPGLLEANCRPYSGVWKPEGTLQEYASEMRYAAFSYLNDSDPARDGGVLRAPMKYIGPTMPGTGGSLISNPNAEWSSTTGVLVDNPDGNAPAGGYSGVINYLNRFGQLTTQNHKNYDPVSELYYAALRYFRNLGNVPAYSNSATVDQADGFPVITTWTDPVQLWCQSNVILGIGDIYTHRDKNLPGSSCTTDEPAKPSQVSSDNINVVTATNAVGQMEGIGNIGNSCNFTGRNNSAYIAGMAWLARSRDMRPDLTAGRTTVSTYWVDVLEAQSLEGMGRNQYALAAKYGGARLPADFDADAWGNTPLPEAWWHTNGETLTPFGSRGSGQSAFKRPDNFYTAGQAQAMVNSLTSAFASVASNLTGSGTSLATSSTKLDAGTRSFQAQFVSGSWNGELKAYAINPTTGRLIEPPLWMASSLIPTWNVSTGTTSRNIFVHDPTGNNAGQRFKAFTWSNLNASQRTALLNEDIVNYLRGDRSKEIPNGTLRTRTGLLGDIVNSQPVFVGQPAPRLYTSSQTFTGSSTYASFVNAQANRTPMVYVGANDGMLHGFNVNTGVESFAFVPNSVINTNLRSYALPNYEHKYFVDGELTVADVYFTSGGGSWRTILVGTLGRGGPGLFALDVTNPSAVSFLWEVNASTTGLSALGRNIGKPIIAQVADGDWRVILGNGPDSASGSADLIMIRITDGAVFSVPTNVGGNNGLSSVFTWDSDSDGFVDAAYAGDLQGNLWRFNNLAGTPQVTKIFQAMGPDGNQPITAAPLVLRNPDTGQRWVTFGTGKYLNSADTLNTDVQSWYGLKDSGAIGTGPLIAGRGNLLKRNILAEGMVGDFAARVIDSGLESDLSEMSGWYIDLVSPNEGEIGERMVVPNFLQGDVLIGTSRTPDSTDICRPSGTGFVMAINPFTGARLTRTFFDLTVDGNFNDADKLLVDGQLVDVSGVGFISAPNNPLFVENLMQTSLDDGTVSTLLTSGSSVNARRTSWREILGN